MLDCVLERKLIHLWSTRGELVGDKGYKNYSYVELVSKLDKIDNINKAMIQLKGINRHVGSFTFLERLELTALKKL